MQEETRRLFQQCAFGNGHAHLLSQALAFARPEDLKKDIIREFWAKCHSFQALICAEIPWASELAERSRATKGLENGSATQKLDDDAPAPESRDDVLAELLACNDALIKALRLHADLERAAMGKEVEDVRQKEYGGQLERPHVYGASPSSSPPLSPTPPPPGMSIQQPISVPSGKHPLRPHIPELIIPGTTPSLPSPYLPPPPSAPQGPRAPAFVAESLPSSSEIYSLPAAPSVPLSVSTHPRPDLAASSTERPLLHTRLPRLQVGNSMIRMQTNISSDDAISTPVRPSTLQQNVGLVPPPPAPHGPRSPTASLPPSPEKYNPPAAASVHPPLFVSAHFRADSAASSTERPLLHTGLPRLEIGNPMVDRQTEASPDDTVLTPATPSALKRNVKLVPPPPAPHGPRSPTASIPPSLEKYRSPAAASVHSPLSVSPHSRADSSVSNTERAPLHDGKDRLHIADPTADDAISTPVTPGAKVLGQYNLDVINEA
ncbi:hypothetical protein FIBSPDRAFT_144645 [Athelia psychrophila]|uniref:Uncharacterized protein n=1 Tax=Athelia psychrophila TaxID=1759441 RepID=A0A166T2W0_9AGAM|nr:hypothetical protein FIBSPDRAFT_144645 [Fibularhizoctonia sp. CBS 109695]